MTLTARPLGWALAGWMVAGAVIVATVWMMLSVAGRADVPVEAVSSTTLAVAATGALASVAAAVWLAVTRDRDLALLSMIASSVTVVGLLVLLPLGLPLAAGAFYVVRRRVDRGGAPWPAMTGPLFALGFTVLTVIWVQPPVVDCQQHGVSVSSRPWWTSGSDSGSASSSPDGVFTGSVETPSGPYTYRCESGSLVEFERVLVELVEQRAADAHAVVVVRGEEPDAFAMPTS